MRENDAARLLRFVRLARPAAATVVEVTREDPGDTPRHNATRSDATRYDATRYDATRYDATRYDATRYDATRYDGPRDGTPGAVSWDRRDAAPPTDARAADPYEDRRRHADRIVRHWRTEIAPLSALPGVAGRFGGPVREVLGATVQGVLVLSLAHLCEVDDEFDQVRLLSLLVLDEELPTGWRPPPDAELAVAVATDAQADLDGDSGSDDRDSWQHLLQRAPAGVVKLAREMWGVRRLVGKRAEGRLWHRTVANVPAVGLVGATLGERHAAIEIAARAYVALGLSRELPAI